MNSSASWLAELRRLLFVVLAAALLGWIFGRPLLFVALGLFLLCGWWISQMWRIWRWLGHPEEDPPESHGIWGNIYDRIYHLQRENREARRQLQSSVDYLQDSFASMREGVVMIDEGGSIQWSNAAAERLLGLKYPADRGQTLLNLVRLPEFHSYFIEEDFSEPLQMAVAGEQERFFQIEITPFGDGDRLVFVRDVTALVKLEHMRRDFVGNVSHELRTPLTVIIGYIDTILATGSRLEKPLVKPLKQMQQQAQRMETLLKDLLWLSRIESVKTEQKTDQIDVASMIEELRDDLKNTYPERAVVVQIETRQKVLGDYRELRSALSNLALNALKYSTDEVDVTLRWAEVEGEYLLSVKDRGIGIDSIHLPRLTERFYRVDDSRSTNTGGTGLGLAIVKHVAAAHDAELRIDSRLGRGSTFTIAFPPP